MKQKLMALINDLSGFGRCSLTVSLPLISALKIECAVLPTCILSSHTAYPSYFYQDCTDDMDPWMDEWKKLNLHFNGIYTGFLGSARQIGKVLRFLRLFKEDQTLVIVDPVMGDHGKIYDTYTDEMCDGMIELVRKADIILPNLTEACRLLNRDYREDFTLDELNRIGSDLLKEGPACCAITGVEQGDEILDLVFEKGREMRVLRNRNIEPSRHGTGDVFASVAAAKAVNGEDFYECVRAGSDFVRKCLKVSEKMDVPAAEGVAFEEVLTELH